MSKPLGATRCIAFAIMFYGACPTVSTAQSVSPGQISRTITDQAGPGRIDDRYQQQTRPTLRAPVDSSDDDSVASDISDSDAPAFILRAITISGNTAFSDDDLRLLYAQQLEQSVTLVQIKKIAATITAFYRNEGYILSRAIVPPQRVDAQGIVSIQIVEGFVDTVDFQGADKQNADILAGYASNITAQRPLNNATLERYLLLLDDLSGTRARGILRPSETTVGASTLTVMLDHTDVDGQLFANNRGSRFLGPVQGGVTLNAHSQLGMSERIQMRGIVSANLEELRYYSASYRQPVGKYGTIISLSGSYSETQPGGNLEPLNVEGESLSFGLEFEHPIMRSRSENMKLYGGLRYRDSASDILSTGVFEDKIRTFHAGVRYDLYDGWNGLNYSDLGITQGVDVFNANDADDVTSRANGNNRFTKIAAYYSRVQPIWGRISAYGSVSGQYSFDPLLSPEEFSIGGQSYGSAYDPAEITGDSGVAARMELRYADALNHDYLKAYQIYGFYDGGKVWNRQLLSGESDHDSLTSTGGGLRVNLPYDISASFELAVPLTREVNAEGSDGDEVRGFFSLDYRF